MRRQILVRSKPKLAPQVLPHLAMGFSACSIGIAFAIYRGMSLFRWFLKLALPLALGISIGLNSVVSEARSELAGSVRSAGFLTSSKTTEIERPEEGSWVFKEARCVFGDGQSEHMSRAGGSLYKLNLSDGKYSETRKISSDWPSVTDSGSYYSTGPQTFRFVFESTNHPGGHHTIAKGSESISIDFSYRRVGNTLIETRLNLPCFGHQARKRGLVQWIYQPEALVSLRKSIRSL